MAMMNYDLGKNFIMFDGKDGTYVVYDETQVNEIGRFYTDLEAKKYIKTMKKKEDKMDFQVGDKVVCLLNGNGVVVKNYSDTDYPILVLFNNKNNCRYTKNGKIYDRDEYPCLFHEGTDINIRPAEPKRYPWVNIYLGGDNICGGAMWNTKDDAMQNIRENNGKYIDTIQH